MQRGFDSDLPYWVCAGCGEVLIRPDIESESGVLWRCDRCGDVLNAQEGFNEEEDSWECRKCGYSNKLSLSEVYSSVDELESDLESPYKGLSDADALALSWYDEVEGIDNRDDIILVRNMESGELYVKKILSIYNADIYRHLVKHPVEWMPRIYEVYESAKYLIVIEEYIEGKTLQELLEDGPLEADLSAYIARNVCYIASLLHNQKPPIVHRDIKPSNVMIGEGGKVFLLDMNAAKWIKSDEVEDTRLMGTQYYAAPEQIGYGFSASSDKSDIYAIGMLLNVMATGKFPKESKAEGPIWDIVEKCICLEPEERLSDRELIEALEGVLDLYAGQSNE